MAKNQTLTRRWLIYPWSVDRGVGKLWRVSNGSLSVYCPSRGLAAIVAKALQDFYAQP